MKQIVIITHRTMAKGMTETIKFFAGNVKNLHYICAYEDNSNEFPIKQVNKLLDTFHSQDQIFILTDLLGGSVNQHCAELMHNRGVNVITGINLALALSIVLEPNDHLSEQRINELIDQAKKQMVFMNDYDGENEDDDE